VDRAIELIDLKYGLYSTPIEKAIPLYGLSKFLRLGCLGCCNPYKGKRKSIKRNIEKKLYDKVSDLH
jgi:hypothetical protein